MGLVRLHAENPLYRLFVVHVHELDLGVPFLLEFKLFLLDDRRDVGVGVHVGVEVGVEAGVVADDTGSSPSLGLSRLPPLSFVRIVGAGRDIRVW